MGVDLLSDHGDERFSAWAWDHCCERAIEFGWKPEGTVAAKEFPGEWSGGYGGNDFQMVTDSDARSLGEALQRAVSFFCAITPFLSR